MSRTRRISAAGLAIPAPGFAALVDLLLATIGVFVIIFALQEVVEAAPLQPAAVDGLLLCDGTEVTAHHRVRGTESLAAAEAEAAIVRLWPDGARLWVGLTESCSFSEARGQLRDAADNLGARAGDGAWLLELAPLGAEDAPELIARWGRDA